MPDAIFPQKISFASLPHNPDKVSHNPDRLTGDSLELLLHNSDQITVDLGERRSLHTPVERQKWNPSMNLGQGSIFRRSPHAPTERFSSYPSVNLREGSIFRQSPHAPTEPSQRQDSAKASRQQQLQEAITDQWLTDYLRHLKSLGFFGEQTQLFCLNFAQDLQWGCGV